MLSVHWCKNNKLITYLSISLFIHLLSVQLNVHTKISNRKRNLSQDQSTIARMKLVKKKLLKDMCAGLGRLNMGVMGHYATAY